MLRALITIIALAAVSPVCFAQFSDQTETITGFALDISGDLVRAEGAPPIEAEDEVAAFFGDIQLGHAVLSAADAASGTYPRFKVYGDNPNTSAVEGPAAGEVITFRYYDASTNTVYTDVRALNDGNEPVNYQWNGSEVIPLPIDLGIPLNETDEVTLRIGTGTGDDNSGGGGGSGQLPSGNPDVNGDGRVTKEDAALVLRVVVGGSRRMDAATVARADVNGDGTVSTDDAIAVLRAQ